ncbi:MAG: penicillin-binding protein 1C [Flavobacteriales bacterium]|nr:MAG: penicillin-binding protein 1C [Flavobacteriales bacterium]
MRFFKKHKFKLLFFFALLVWYYLSLPSLLFSDPTCTVIEDKSGHLLGAKIADDGQWRFPHNDTVPEKFEKAIIQFEDRSFHYHPGVNPFSIFRAMWQNVKEWRKVSGGSTLTMQTIRLSRKGQSRTVFEKLIEMILATRIEIAYSKNEILAFYASNAPFGGNVVGLDAATWRYFGRSPEKLSWAEAATLAVLPNAPSLIHPGKNREKLFNKRNRLLDRLLEAEEIDSSTCELSKLEPLPEKPHPLPQLASHLLTRIYLEGNKGKRIKTTIDTELQTKAIQIAEKHHRQLKGNEIYNIAILVLDVENGNALAYIGNMGERNEHGSSVDCITAPRSTGSIMKPFLYAAMLKDGMILPNTLIPDIPTHIAGYAPKNYTLQYDGAVPAYRALSRSLNIPAVRMLQNYGLERFHYLLPKIGVTTINQPANHYGLSLILGGAEATLWDLCSIYASMSRTLNHFSDYNGQYNSDDWKVPNYKSSHEKGDVQRTSGLNKTGSLSAASIWLTYQALVQVNRPANESGWNRFSSSQKIAWKTGTSFGHRDAWAIGTTPNYVVGVWVGNADGEGRPLLTGITAAAPVLFDVFDLLPTGGNWFEPPYDELQKVPVCKQSGHRTLDNCTEIDSMWVNISGLKTKPCPYHQLVHLDSKGQYRVNSSCYTVSEMTHKTWFVLPPVQEWYYKSKNSNYQTLPPFRAECDASKGTPAMEFIYPKRGAKVYVPTELDGTQGETIFEVAHRDRGATIYWHLDAQYIGSTTNFHQMGLRPPFGEHIITLVDESGETVVQKFEALARER